MAAKKRRKTKSPAKVHKPKPVAEDQADQVFAEGTVLTGAQFGEHVGKVSNALHHAGCNVPPYLILIGDKHFTTLTIHGNIRRPVDRLRIVGATLSELLCQVTKSGEPVEMMEMQGTPPEKRVYYPELPP